MTDADLVRLLVDFANQNTDLVPARAFVRAPAKIVDLDFLERRLPAPTDRNDFRVFEVDAVTPSICDDVIDAELELLRRQVTVILDAAKAHPDRLIDFYVADEAMRVFPHPVPVKTGRRSRYSMKLKVIGDTHEDCARGVLAYVAAILAADKDLCRSNLGRCRLPECRKFFLIVRGMNGSPRSAFCKNEHRKMFYELTAADRMRTSRANKGEKKPRRSRRSK
jgi:hypothetical protein